MATTGGQGKPTIQGASTGGSSTGLTPHEWHSLLAFGTLAVALGIFDPKFALTVVGVAALVVVVRNSDKIGGFLGA